MMSICLTTKSSPMAAVSDMTIPAEAGDLRLFRHNCQLLKFCGMGLATVQSGVLLF